MKDLKVITLVPPKFREDWLAQCIESVSSQEVELTHYVLPCDDLYSGRKLTYQMSGTITPVDYDDWLEPGLLSKVAEVETDFAFTATAPVQVKRIKTSCMAIHHLTAFTSSLVPESFYKEIESRGLQLHVDWLVKSYIILTRGGVRIGAEGYNWRRHPDQFSSLNQGKFGRITQKCQALLNKIPVLPGFTVTN